MLELEHGYPAVDVHTTLAPAERDTERGWTVAPDRLERELRQAGIVRSLAAAPADATERYVGPNNWVARAAVDRPVVAAARIRGVHPLADGPIDRLRSRLSADGDRATGPEELERYGYSDRFHAFALDPTVDGLPDRDQLETLESVGLPVLVDSSTAASLVTDNLCGRSFPVVLRGFGRSDGDRDGLEAVIDACSDHDDLYLDTSFVAYRDVLERALLEHPDRVLFGSGAPACHPDVAVMAVLTLDVSEDLLRRALWKNAMRVLPALDPTATDY